MTRALIRLRCFSSCRVMAADFQAPVHCHKTDVTLQEVAHLFFKTTGCLREDKTTCFKEGGFY